VKKVPVFFGWNMGFSRALLPFSSREKKNWAWKTGLGKLNSFPSPVSQAQIHLRRGISHLRVMRTPGSLGENVGGEMVSALSVGKRFLQCIVHFSRRNLHGKRHSNLGVRKKQWTLEGSCPWNGWHHILKVPRVLQCPVISCKSKNPRLG
jgi:hypothetical protein